MGNKRKAFYVNGSDGKRHKVKPKGWRFRGNSGDHRLTQDTWVDGNLFTSGYYPFVFWDVPIFDSDDNPIKDTGAPEPTSGGAFLSEIFGDESIPSSHHSSSYPHDPTPNYTPETAAGGD